MKLILYSFGDSTPNNTIDAAVGQIVGNNGTLTYIPSASGPTAEKYFGQTCDLYRKYGVKHFNYFPVDASISEEEVTKALCSEAIYLSGGNTFYFLNSLRKNSLLSKLNKYVLDGGCLVGLSAGAIITTPTIAIAAHLPGGGDSNDVGLSNLSAVNLTNFEFAPHFEGDKSKLAQYSKNSANPIYACPDGSGITVDGPKLTFHGPVTCINNGQTFKINNSSNTSSH
jgi:dipeptidase E